MLTVAFERYRIRKQEARRFSGYHPNQLGVSHDEDSQSHEEHDKPFSDPQS